MSPPASTSPSSGHLGGYQTTNTTNTESTAQPGETTSYITGSAGGHMYGTNSTTMDPSNYTNSSTAVGQGMPYATTTGETTTYNIPGETYNITGETATYSIPGETATYSIPSGQQSIAFSTTQSMNYDTYQNTGVTHDNGGYVSTYDGVQYTQSVPYVSTRSVSQGGCPQIMTGDYPIASTASLSGFDYAIQNAINQGRIYAPIGGVYVHGNLALKSGMHTIYDSKVVPTFELPLSFQSSVGARILAARGMTDNSRLTHRSNFVIGQTKKSACC